MKKLIALLFVCLLLAGCSAQRTVYHMDTVMTYDIHGLDAEAALPKVDHCIGWLELYWSATRADSNIGRMNRGESVILPYPDAALLERVQELSDRTGGAFNPKLRSLSIAWGFCHEENQASDYRVPTEEEIAAALADPQWDLGGALKGYAGQEAVKILDTMYIDRALLNLGGNIQTYGEKRDGTPWNVGIQDPDGGDYLGVIAVSGTASIVTSGDYQRCFEQDGKTYHHILDPETGYPADSGLRSVTVICRDGLTADCLSTALFVMGLEEASEFWRASDDFEAVFITTDNKIYATEGAALSGCEFEVIAR